MEFFERIEQMGNNNKKLNEKAAQTLSQLATAIGDAPDASELQADNYVALYNMRVEKAKRAFAKAMHAMANNQSGACINHAERGLLHLQVALVHGHSEIVPLAPSSGQSHAFASGGCEETIQLLGDAICRIKLLAEYKKLDLSKELRQQLANVVQNLQDAIESYGHGDEATALETATGGLVWCQYIYARLAVDALLPPKERPKAVRSLFKLALDAGTAGSEAVARQTKEGREKITALESYLQSGLNAYFDNDITEMDKFVKLGGIAATALTRYVARLKTQELVSAIQADKASEGPQNLSFKQVSNEIRELIDRHHPDPYKALLALEALQFDIAAVRRAMRSEDWKEMQKHIWAARYESDILTKEVAKMTEEKV